MKRTIKQWCQQYKLTWFGQGSIESIRYDWKLVIAKNRIAVFSAVVKEQHPVVFKVNEREILLFPNINSSKKNGQISELKFKEILGWVERCLDGDIADFSRIPSE